MVIQLLMMNKGTQVSSVNQHSEYTKSMYNIHTEYNYTWPSWILGKNTAWKDNGWSIVTENSNGWSVTINSIRSHQGTDTIYFTMHTTTVAAWEGITLKTTDVQGIQRGIITQ